LLATCRKVYKHFAFRHTAMSVVDVETLIWEVKRRPHMYKKNLKDYSDRNLKKKLWREVCKSVELE